jgi:porin
VIPGPSDAQDDQIGEVRENQETTEENQEHAAEAQASEAEPTHKSDYDRKPAFGGPNSPEGQLEEDDRVKKPALRMGGFDGALGPWFEWKRKANESYGLQISGHYVSLYQSLSDSLGEEDDAWSGLFRLTTKWALTGRGTGNEGSLVLTVDHRHAFTDVAPANLGSEAGYIGLTGMLLNDIDGAIIYLNWAQSLNDGNAGLLIGRFDPNDYMAVLGYANPWTSFQNLAILLESSITFPDSSWGIGVGSWFNDKWWILGSVNDANGAATDDLEFFDGGSELFSQVSFGWSPSKDERYFNSLNATVWHVDERTDAGIEGAHGIALAANRTWNQKWMVFARAGFSDGSAPIYNRSATAGFIRHFAYRSDLVGLGVNWGDPPADELREQITVEGFYRFQLAQNLAITPSVQYLIDPALNREDDAIWVTGLRLRFTF